MNGLVKTQPADVDGAQGDAQVTAPASDLITQGAICKQLGISSWTWKRWVLAGRTPQRVDLPGRPRWRRDEIERFAGAPEAGRYFRSAGRRHGRQISERT